MVPIVPRQFHISKAVHLSNWNRINSHPLPFTSPRTPMAPATLRGCAGSQEPSLIDFLTHFGQFVNKSCTLSNAFILRLHAMNELYRRTTVAPMVLFSFKLMHRADQKEPFSKNVSLMMPYQYHVPKHSCCK